MGKWNKNGTCGRRMATNSEKYGGDVTYASRVKPENNCNTRYPISSFLLKTNSRITRTVTGVTPGIGINPIARSSTPSLSFPRASQVEINCSIISSTVTVINANSKNGISNNFNAKSIAAAKMRRRISVARRLGVTRTFLRGGGSVSRTVSQSIFSSIVATP